MVRAHPLSFFIYANNSGEGGRTNSLPTSAHDCAAMNVMIRQIKFKENTYPHLLDHLPFWLLSSALIIMIGSIE